ncbi:MAG: 5'-nucleotidase C-terminal domain-containing protein [Lachnospirales bacterium]
MEEDRNKDPNLLVVDSGDTIESNMINLFNGDEIHPMVKAFNMLGYDAWATGNHEFNFGLDVLNNAIGDFEGVSISSNILKEDGSYFVDPYIVKDYDGVKVAFIGMVAPHVKRWEASTPEHFKGLDFIDPVKAAQKAMDLINEKEDADVVIGVFHLGISGEGYDPELTDSASIIFEEVEGFDAAFLGHAHSTFGDADDQVFSGDTIVVEPGFAGANLAKIEIDVVKTDDGYDVVDKRTDLLETTGVEPSKAVLKEFKYVDDRSKEAAYEAIGTATEEFLPQENFKGIPVAQIQDSAVIDLINEVQTFYSGADVSAAALFDTKSNLEAGEIQFKDAALIYKYSNTLQGHKISGKNLKEYMEWSASFYNTAKKGDLTVSFNEDIRGYNYDMFSGVNYKIDISKEPGNRIVDLTFKGKAITDDMEFVLAINNYRVGTLQGLGLLPEDGSSIVYDSTSTPTPEMQRLITKYIKEEKAGVISPNVDNNWKIKNAPIKKDGFYAQYLVNNDYITIPKSEDGRTLNVKSLNALEALPAVEEIELLQSGKLTDNEKEAVITAIENNLIKNYGELYEFTYLVLTADEAIENTKDTTKETAKDVPVEEVKEETISAEVTAEPVSEKYINNSAIVFRRTYVVQDGDTLSEIAEKYHVDLDVLSELNGLSNPNMIYTWNELILR